MGCAAGGHRSRRYGDQPGANPGCSCAQAAAILDYPQAAEGKKQGVADSSGSGVLGWAKLMEISMTPRPHSPSGVKS